MMAQLWPSLEHLHFFSPRTLMTTDNAPTSQWLKITFSCPTPLLEPAADLLAVLSGTGVEQSPETATGATLSGFFQVATANVDDQAPAATTEEIIAEVSEQLADLFALYDQAVPALTSTLLADEDWATSWQQYFKPFEIVPGLVIKPTWEDYQPEQSQRVIEMDPGMAFGTGQHASTRMALALIQEAMAQVSATSALDVGTGTGILAMAAALFGAGQVVAIDNDPDAVRVAAENIAQNGLTKKIATSTTPLAEIQGRYPLVCANIVHDVLVEMAPDLAARTTSGGQLVLAGILHGEQEANIITVYAAQGLSLENQMYQDEWVSLRLRRN